MAYLCLEMFAFPMCSKSTPLKPAGHAANTSWCQPGAPSQHPMVCSQPLTCFLCHERAEEWWAGPVRTKHRVHVCCGACVFVWVTGDRCVWLTCGQPG